jgi:hypothetical protein
LMARPFDAESLTFTGEPIPLADRVNVAGNGAAAFTVSGTGDFIYRESLTQAPATQALVWFDRASCSGRHLTVPPPSAF